MEEPGLGRRLLDAFEHATQLLAETNPPLIPITGQASRFGARKLILHRFPFSLVTVQNQHTVTVVALAHHA